MDKFLRSLLTRAVVKWLLFSVVILYVITGLAITQMAVSGPVALAGLIRGWSFAIHTNLIIPLLVLLALHIYLYFYCRRRR